MHLKGYINDRVHHNYKKSVGHVLTALTNYLKMGMDHWKDDIQGVYTQPVTPQKLGFVCGLTDDTVREALDVAIRDGLIVPNPNLARSWRFVPEAILALPSGYKSKNIDMRAAACERRILRAVRAKFYYAKKSGQLLGQKILMAERGKGQPPVSTFTDPPQLMAIGKAWPAQHPHRMRPPTADGEPFCSVATSSYWNASRALAKESGLPPLGQRCECGVDLNDPPQFQHARGVFCGQHVFKEWQARMDGTAPPPAIVETTEETIDPEVSKQISADFLNNLRQAEAFTYFIAAFNCTQYDTYDTYDTIVARPPAIIERIPCPLPELLTQVALITNA